jgi:competence protein ComEA
MTFAAAMIFASSGALAAVNVNTAQQSELQRTQGLDKYKAKAIIEYRAANGPFTKIEELENVNGFNRETVEKVRAQLALTGAPYVPPPKPEPKAKKPAGLKATAGSPKTP